MEAGLERARAAKIVKARTEVGEVVVVGDRIVEPADLGELYRLVKSDLSLCRRDVESRVPRTAIRAAEPAAERMRVTEAGVDHRGMRDGPHEFLETNPRQPLQGRDQIGQRVRMRIGNLGAMDHHPFHIHGLEFLATETDGGQIPESAQWPETTVLVAVGQTRTIEMVPEIPGDWAMHCHMTHHVMNQMGHEFPNMIGVEKGDLDNKVRKILPGYMTMGETGMGDMGDMGMAVPKNSIPMVGGRGKHDYITMGGMFTILKVRDQLASYEDPGWYENPPGTLSIGATAAELRRDGIDPSVDPTPVPGEVRGVGV